MIVRNASLNLCLANIVDKSENLSYIIYLLAEKMCKNLERYIQTTSRQLEKNQLIYLSVGKKEFMKEKNISQKFLTKKKSIPDITNFDLKNSGMSNEEKIMFESLLVKLQKEKDFWKNFETSMKRKGILIKEGSGYNYCFETNGFVYKYVLNGRKTAKNLSLKCTDNRCNGHGSLNRFTEQFILKREHSIPYKQHKYFDQLNPLLNI